MLADTGDGGFALIGTVEWPIGMIGPWVLYTSDVIVHRFGPHDPWISITTEADPSRLVQGIDNGFILKADIQRFPGSDWGEDIDVWTDSSLDVFAGITLNDDGKNGDELSNDGIYSRWIMIPPDAPPGRHVIDIHIQDKFGLSTSTMCYLNLFPSQNEAIYDEGLEDWIILPHDMTIKATSYAASNGNISLEILPSPQGYIDIVPPNGYPFLTMGYKSLDFDINPGNCSQFQPRLYLAVDYDLEYNMPNLLLYGPGYNYLANQWTQVSIPLDMNDRSLNKRWELTNQSIKHFRLGGTIKEGPFFVDNIRLTSYVSETIIPAILLLLGCTSFLIIDDQFGLGRFRTNRSD
jgi:hypothetical protein